MPSNLESLNNYPTWYTDYGDTPTSSPPATRDIIYDAGYDPDKVTAEFGEMFEDYDPTREQFAQDRLQSQEQAVTLNYDQNVAQAERDLSLTQAQLGSEGFLAQALQREQESSFLRDKSLYAQQGRVAEARGIAGQEVELQRGLTQAEQGFSRRDFSAAQRRLGLEEQEIGAAAAQQQAALRDRMSSVGTEQAEAMRRAASQEAGVGREEERLALAEAGAETESQFALGRLGREREELGLQAQQAALAGQGIDLEGREIGIQRDLSEEERAEIDIQRQLSGVERDEIGMQRDISDIQRGRFGLQRETSALEQQEAEAGIAQLQAQMGQQVAGARRGMMQAYQAAEADTSGFAGAGARDIAQQRAIQGYAGDAAAGIQGLRARGESLRRGMGRFDIAGREVGLEEQAFDVGAGRFGLAEERLDIGEGRFDIAERRLDIGAGRYDIAEERLDLKRGGLDVEASRRAIGEQDLQAQEAKEKADLERQLDQYDVTARDLAGRTADIQGGLATQQQRFAQQQRTINRQTGEVAQREARQMAGVDLTRQTQQTGYDRRVSQLGGQLSGYDLQDASNKLRFDEQSGRLETQIAQNAIQARASQAQYDERTGAYQSQLEGIEAQLGEEGFLQRGLQNTLGQMGGRFAEEVYGLRDQYGDEVRNRIMDLIRDEGLDSSYLTGGPQFSEPLPGYGRYEDVPQGNVTRGASAGACFLAGTNVETSKGKQPIESIKVGDTVLSTDLKSKNKVQSEVTETFVHDDADKYLVINDKIKATPNHPFYSNGEWKEIGELSIGDKILHVDGVEHKIESIEQIDEPVTVYNIEVDKNHNYFAEGYLVHNK